MTIKERNSLALGIIFAFGFPAVAWVYFDWRAGLLTFVLGQALILFAKVL